MTSSTQRWIESGTPSSRVWLVGEAPGPEEVRQGAPLVGPSGRELNSMLAAAGWPTSTPFFKTNIAHERPPSYTTRQGKVIQNDIDQWFPGKLAARRLGLPEDRGRYPAPPVRHGLARLEALLSQHRPELIILLGGTPLWGLCGKEGVTKWRGSVLRGPDGIKCVSTLHPAVIADPSRGMATYRPIIIQDLRRALRELTAGPTLRRPQCDFTIAPNLSQVRERLQSWAAGHTPLVCDTEGWGVIDCIGLAPSSSEALCIPFTVADGSSYWSLDDECQVFGLLHHALRACPVTFHNAIWDMQVIGRRWGFLPRLQDDTMVAQHVAFPGLLGGKIDPVTGRVDKRGSSLSLSFCASMYCDLYSYWKDDGRLRADNQDDTTFWRYNCEDCVRTYEVRAELVDRVLPSADLVPQYRFQMSLFGPVLRMMFRGVRLDPSRVQDISMQIQADRAAQQAWLATVLGYPLNVHKTEAGGQMQTLFYEDLGCQPVFHRQTRQRTLNDDALETIARREPLLVPLIRHCQNIRSLDTNEATFVRPALAAGDRLRSCFNIAGPETFRFSSNETAFGEGMNLQNLTRPQD